MTNPSLALTLPGVLPSLALMHRWDPAGADFAYRAILRITARAKNAQAVRKRIATLAPIEYYVTGKVVRPIRLRPAVLAAEYLQAFPFQALPPPPPSPVLLPPDPAKPGLQQALAKATARIRRLQAQEYTSSDPRAWAKSWTKELEAGSKIFRALHRIEMAEHRAELAVAIAADRAQFGPRRLGSPWQMAEQFGLKRPKKGWTW